MALRAMTTGDLVFNGRYGVGIVLEKESTFLGREELAPPLLRVHFRTEGILWITEDDCMVVARAHPVPQ